MAGYECFIYVLFTALLLRSTQFNKHPPLNNGFFLACSLLENFIAR